VPTLGATTWFRVIATCTNTGGSNTLTANEFFVAGTTVKNIPYIEDFETIPIPDRWPNCSWYAQNLGVSVGTYTGAANANRVARSGSKFVAFGLPSTNNIVYSNGLNLQAGITYSAAIWHATEYTGANNWNSLSIKVGTAQAVTGLTTVASVGPAVGGQYKLLSGVFTVPASGVYYIGVEADASPGTAAYLSWDDLSVTIPCYGPGAVNAPTVTMANASSTVCEGTNVTLNAAGAHSYVWSTGSIFGSTSFVAATNETISVTGTHSLTGCTDEAVLNLQVYPTPVISTFAYPPNACVGTSVSIVAVGAGSYTWNTGSNASAITVIAGNAPSYSVQGSNMYGCKHEATQVMNPLPLPVIQVTGPVQICSGEQVILQASGASSYQWYSSSAPLILQGAQVNVIPVVSSSYTVYGLGANGCTGNGSYQLAVEACTGIRDAEGQQAWTLFPNPSSGIVTITSDRGGKFSYEVTDVSGRLMDKGTGEGSTGLDISVWPAGVYLLKLENAGGLWHQRLIRQ
jgi:hypothetical protein